MEKPNLETYGLTKNELENYPKNKSLFDLEYKKHLKANKRTCLFIALSLAILLFAFLAFVFSDNTPNDGVGTAVVIMLFFGLPVIMLIAFIIYNHMDKKEEIKARFFSNELEDRYTKYVDALEEYNHFIEQNNRNYWIQMTGLQFEKELACLFRSKGYDATVTSATGDGGVDIILRKDGEKIAVQCKHHAKPVGPNDVRALQGVVASQNYSKGIFISLNGYTSTVYQEIRRGTIKIDLLDLKDILKIAKNDVLPCTKDHYAVLLSNAN